MKAKRKFWFAAETGCIASNSLEVYKKFNEKLSNSEISVEPIIKATGCNGLCEKGPVVKNHARRYIIF